MFQIHKTNGTVCNFVQSMPGLYYMDVDEQGTTLINTVADNKNKYTNSDYSRASLARQIQITIGRPSTKDFIRIVEQGLLPNCPITRDDIKAAEDIFGPDVGSMKGKTVRHSPKGVRPNIAQVPHQILDRYRDVTLCGDIMFINRIPFLMTISRNIKFGTAERLENREAATIAKAIKNVHDIYRTRGFKVTTILMDGEFQVLAGNLAELGVVLNTAANDEHVGDIERYIRTVKERCRCVYTTLPFTRMPARLVIEMVHYSVFWLNCFAPINGISEKLSPRAIVTGIAIDYDKHCMLQFGTYVQTHEEHNNSMLSRTTGAIAMRPTGNVQGGYYFMSLTTGRRLNRYRWTQLPMPQDVIDRVGMLARRQNNRRGLEYLDRGGLPSDENDDPNDDPDGDNDDATYLPPDTNDDDDDDSDFGDYSSQSSNSSEGGNTNNTTNDANPNANANNAPNANDANKNVNNLNDNDNNIEDDNSTQNENDEEIHPNISDITDDEQYEQLNPDDRSVESEDDRSAILDNDDIIDNNEPINELINEANLDELYGKRQHNYGLRPRRPRGYGHPDMNQDYVFDETLLTQYSMKRGLKEFGNDRINAVLKELQQLHVRKVMKPVKGDGLSREERHRALAYLMFLKKKRCGTIKGRGCADGRKQRAWTSKEDASSPTVAIESVLILCTIDAKERRDIGTVDLPGAFMHGA